MDYNTVVLAFASVYTAASVGLAGASLYQLRQMGKEPVKEPVVQAPKPVELREQKPALLQLDSLVQNPA